AAAVRVQRPIERHALDAIQGRPTAHFLIASLVRAAFRLSERCCPAPLDEVGYITRRGWWWRCGTEQEREDRHDFAFSSPMMLATRPGVKRPSVAWWCSEVSSRRPTLMKERGKLKRVRRRLLPLRALGLLRRLAVSTRASNVSSDAARTSSRLPPWQA